jgi:hypothetical protein
VTDDTSRSSAPGPTTNSTATLSLGAFNATPVPGWAVGAEPEPAERGPPADWDAVDHGASEAGSNRETGPSSVPWVLPTYGTNQAAAGHCGFNEERREVTPLSVRAERCAQPFRVFPS